MTEEQDASQTTHLAPPALSPPLGGERELLTWKRREKEEVFKEEQINKRITTAST